MYVSLYMRDFCHLCLICVQHQAAHFPSVCHFHRVFVWGGVMMLVPVVTMLLCLYGVTVTVVATDVRYCCSWWYGLYRYFTAVSFRVIFLGGPARLNITEWCLVKCIPLFCVYFSVCGDKIERVRHYSCIDMGGEGTGRVSGTQSLPQILKNFLFLPGYMPFSFFIHIQMK